VNRNDILEILKTYKETSAYKRNINKIGIFGSLAKGEFTDSSDIDVAVDLKTPKMFDLIGIKQDLEKIIKRHVDIVMIRKRMNPLLKERIDEDGVYV